MMGRHWLRFDPVGAVPEGQHTPVEVTSPARQQVAPVAT
jgi:hypothetical protein